MYFEDEARFGLFTKAGKALTARGIKPKCKFQQVFKSTYIFGCFSPINGANFCLELPYCNAANFQLFLDKFSKRKKEELKVIVLDNGAFHKAKSLKIPPNIILIFLPPYSPELNPAEKIWWGFKRNFGNLFIKDLDGISKFIKSCCNGLKAKAVKSTCSFGYVFLDTFWSR